MAPYRITIICFLAVISAFSRPVAAQETQDMFRSELTEVSLAQDSSRVQELISEHRLWVKPVVNQLISDYIHRTMMGNRGGAQKYKEAARLIAQTFQDSYGERSLSIATSYLDSWTMEQMGKKAQADRIYGIATDLRIEGQFEEAEEKFHMALGLYTDIGDIRGEGEVLGGLGYIYYVSGLDTCLSYYQMALEARVEVDDKYLVGGTVNTIGLIYYNYFYDLERSIEYFNKAAVIREEIGHWAGLGSTLSILGEVYKFNGEPELALQSFEKSYLIHKKAGNPFRMAEAKINSGSILIGMGRYPEAMNNLHVSLAMSQEMNDTLLLGDVYAQLAKAHTYMGDYDTAIKNATTAFSMYESIDDAWGLAGAYNNTGLVLDEVGRRKKALEYYEKSLEIYTELGDQEHLIILSNNLGIIEFSLGKFNKAEEYHLQALAISNDMQLESGKLSSLVNLANAQNRLDKLDEALANYESALLLSKQLHSPDTEWRVMVGIAENYKLRGDYSKAIEYNEAGLSIIEVLRTTLQSEEYRSTYLARERFAFEDVIHMLGELHDMDQTEGYDLLAFEYAQRCKSRSFLDQMENTNQEIAGEKENFSAKTISLKDIQKSVMDETTVVLEYSLGDSCSYLWVISGDAHKMIKLPDRKTLHEQVETFRFSILNPKQDNKAFLRQSGYNLYKHLIQPAEAFLSKKSNLVILPDGVLNYIPFQVLITDPPDKHPDQSFKELSYLIKNYPISYGQSSSVLVNLIEERSHETDSQQTPKDLIAFGDPLYTIKGSDNNLITPEFKRLEYSGPEVEGIAGFFKDEMADIYIRENASEENIKRDNRISDYRYIHFACHGLVDEKNPENSSLVLSLLDSSVEDGFLQASEISVLKLNADMVVLSACETGLGKLIRGEGMIGLSRSFMYAGTPSLVVSLWSVSDMSTSILMKEFYKNLIRKGLSKADALHLAQIYMIKDETYAHPFFWAPFVLTGDWK